MIIYSTYKNKTIKKITLIITALALGSLLKAQERSTFNFSFNHIAFSVKDLSRSVEFYKNVLQLNEIVIALYDVAQTWTNDKHEVVKISNIKITHTWKKTDKGWLIIGGMGANK